jgi:1-acyl-sn-glycerol-3-phosphate acyltransferase
LKESRKAMAKSVLGSDPLARVKGRSPKLLAAVSSGRRGDGKPSEEDLPEGIYEPAIDKRIATFERHLNEKLTRFDAELEREEGFGRSLDPTLKRRLREALHRLEERAQRLASLVVALEEEEQHGLLESIIAFGDAFQRAIRFDTYRHYLNNLGMRDRRFDVDEFGMEIDARESVLPLVEFLYHKWWRVEVQGIENVPDSGAALIVSNHSGVIPYDGVMIAYAIEHLHPARRTARFLVEDWVATLPFFSSLITRFGGVRACRENAERILRGGDLAAAFPEGVKGMEKYYHERYRLQRFGRGGFVKMCLETGAPIIPAAVIGAEEIHPVLYKASWMANALRLPFLPVSPTFPWLGALGLLPLPSKWTIRFGEPVSLAGYGPRDGESDYLVNQLKERVRSTIQQMLNEGLAERRSIWFG